MTLFMKFLCQNEKKVVGPDEKKNTYSREALNKAIFFLGLSSLMSDQNEIRYVTHICPMYEFH